MTVDIGKVSKQKRPFWPSTNGSGPQPALGGPAFGLRSIGNEGVGLGRCFAVLAGGMSGGHSGSVTGLVCYLPMTRLSLKHNRLNVYMGWVLFLLFLQAFHPRMMIIATCGVGWVLTLYDLFVGLISSYL